MQIITFTVFGSVLPLPWHAASSELNQQTTVEHFCALHIQVIPKYDFFFFLNHAQINSQTFVDSILWHLQLRFRYLVEAPVQGTRNRIVQNSSICLKFIKYITSQKIWLVWCVWDELPPTGLWFHGRWTQQITQQQRGLSLVHTAPPSDGPSL